MKKIIFSIRLFVIAIVALLLAQVPSLAATGKSTADFVRLRQKPSTDSEVINVLAVDDVVEILGKEGDWYKVTFKGNTGYVSQSFISTNENVDNNKSEDNSQKSENNDSKNTNNENKTDSKKQEESNVTENQKANNTSTNKVYNMAENTQVNILPVVTSEIIGEVKKDESVTLIINAGLWVYIKSNNVSGWIRIDKLSTENINVDNSASSENNNEENKEENKAENQEENKENNENNQPAENTESSETKNQENSNENNTQATNFTAKTMYSASTAINVRSASNTDSTVVDSIGINAEVKVVGEENDWYKVEVNGRSGYIRKDLLSDNKTEVTSRNNDLDRAAAKQAATTEQASEPAKTSTNNTNTSSTKSSSGVTGEDIVAYAKQFLGCKYVYGAAGPSSFDCSGLTMYVYKHFGYSLSHSSKVQATQGVAVSGDLQPGDILVFSNDGKTVGHVGIYIGNDKFIHASDSTTGVIISNLHDRWNISKYWGARRILK